MDDTRCECMQTTAAQEIDLRQVFKSVSCQISCCVLSQILSYTLSHFKTMALKVEKLQEELKNKIKLIHALQTTLEERNAANQQMHQRLDELHRQHDEALHEINSNYRTEVKHYLFCFLLWIFIEYLILFRDWTTQTKTLVCLKQTEASLWRKNFESHETITNC